MNSTINSNYDVKFLNHELILHGRYISFSHQMILPSQILSSDEENKMSTVYSIVSSYIVNFDDFIV